MSVVATPENRVEPFVDPDQYEVVDGSRLELPPMGVFQSFLASVLCHVLSTLVWRKSLGRVVVEVLFRLDADGKLQRRPDVAFVSYGRWAKNEQVPDVAAWAVVPNLAAEVVSPSNTAYEIMAKIRDYFRHGVERVWVIYPSVQQVHVYATPTSVQVLTVNDALEDAGLFSGFSLPLRELFDHEGQEAALPVDQGDSFHK